MEALLVEGGHTIGGAVRMAGFKHALVPLLCASVLVDGETALHNVPEIEDAKILARILSELGAAVSRDATTLRVDARALAGARVDDRLAQRIHGALYLLPCLLGRAGEAWLGATGGCRIGDRRAGGERPIHHVLDVLERFGCRFRDAGGVIHGTADALRAARIDVARYSDAADVVTGPLVSGATKAALLAAAVARGVTRIDRPYRKAEIPDLLAFLAAGGVAIEDAGDHLLVEGRPRLRPVAHTLISDVVEIVTFVAAAAHLRAPLRLLVEEVARTRAGLRPELELFEQMGIPLAWDPDGLVVSPPRAALRALDIEVTSQSIYSDSQPFFALLLTAADGVSRIRERVWHDRFGYARGLVELGAQIDFQPGVIRISPRRPERAGQRVRAEDLRAASVLVLAAMGASGTTIVEGTDHLARGYADLPGKLRAIGARLTCVAPAERQTLWSHREEEADRGC
jgi:UDP-N-acetylglucosamine 1-carboxyvinyltransferase